MLKQALLLAALLSLPFMATAAETCPSVDSIRSGNLQGWVAINNDTSHYADPALIKDFEAGAEEFWMAEWTVKYFPPNTPGHCYYLTPCRVDVYLAKDVPRPVIGKQWQQNDGAKQCYSSSVTDCAFN